MAPLIPVAVAMAKQKGGAAAASALKNDIVTYHTTYVKGQGRKKRTIDREVHVNPVSIATGATLLMVGVGSVAILAGVGLFAAGLQAGRDSGTSLTQTARLTQKTADNDVSSQVWTVYNKNNVPIRRITGPITTETAITPSMRARGWTTESVGIAPGSTGDVLILKIRNDDRRHFALSPRPHIAFVNIGGGKLF